MKTLSSLLCYKRKTKIASSAFLISFGIGSAQAQLESGLLSYWDFENNFNDTASTFSVDSTVADNGTGGSGVIFVSDGPFGTYGDFERTGLGTENLVVVPDSADLMAPGEDLTISAWFRVDGLDQNWQALIAHGESSDWRVARRAGEEGLAYAGGTGDLPGAGISPNVNDGNWHHVVAITESGVSTRIWIDGALVATSAAAPNIVDNGANTLYIGGNPQGNIGNVNANQYRPWNGGIDDVALWNRPLTDLEIGQLFTSGQNGNSLGVLLSPEDNDGDTLPDAWETANGLDPTDDGSTNVDNGPLGDPDMDGSNNAQEFEKVTNPQDGDTDNDFLNDGDEHSIGTNPNNPDHDGDTLLDGYETNNGIFVDATDTGTDPLVSDLTVDSDTDELFNVWEITNGLHPFDNGTTDANNGAEGDPDNDASNNLSEQTNDTDPQDNDSDDDFSLDGEEETRGTDPLDPDSDDDTLLDGHETDNGLQSYLSPTDTGTDPMNPDTDLDGFNDNVEIILNTDPTDPNSTPTAAGLPIVDDFEDGTIDLATWSTITQTVSQNATGTLLGGTIAEADGSLQIGSRGYLYTVGEFDPEFVGGLEITGELTFLTASDFVSVITRATPTPLARYGEAESGVQFLLSANGDTLNIAARNGDHSIENVLVEGTIDFVTNVVYVFKVTDDGLGALSMVVNEKDVPENMISVTADLTADISDTNHVVIYNRENGRNSNLSQIEIKALIGDIQDTVIQDVAYDPASGANGSVTLTWNSDPSVTYSIFASPDLIDWELEVNDDVPGLEGTTSETFPNPIPGSDKLFFRVVPRR